MTPQPQAPINKPIPQSNKPPSRNPNRMSNTVSIGVLFVVITMILLILAGITNGVVIIFQQKAINFQEQNSKFVAQLTSSETISSDMVKTLNAVFAENDDVMLFINKIESIQKAFTAFEFTFTEDIPQGEKAPYYLPFSIRATGRKQSLLNFISGLYTYPLALTMENIELVQTDEKTDTGEWNLSIVGALYVSDDFAK